MSKNGVKECQNGRAALHPNEEIIKKKKQNKQTKKQQEKTTTTLNQS